MRLVRMMETQRNALADQAATPNGSAGPSGGAATFKERFCAHFGCAPEEFARVAIWKLLHRRSIVLGWVMLKLNPRFFETDLAMIEQIGLIDSRANLAAQAQDLRNDYARAKDYGVLRRLFKVRLSGQRLLKVASEVWS